MVNENDYETVSTKREEKSISEVCRLGHTLNINTTIARIDDDGWMEGGELH